MMTSPQERWIGPALMACCVLLYVPFAGNYGLWDPWETHYGEVARQMAERSDVVSLYYPCSPIEGRWFWSKPVLTFWLMAPTLRLFGLSGLHARAGELTDSWRAEWAARMPSLVLALCAVWALFVLVRRLVGVRAAVLCALVLATCPSFILIARQAMTDMPFVVPMTIALVFAALGLLPDQDPGEPALPRRSYRRWSWPHATGYYALLATVAIAGAVPLVLITIQLHGSYTALGRHLRVPGLVILAPYFFALVLALWWSMKLTSRRAVYLLSAWVWCGAATLAKGPAGLALPALVLVAYLVAAGRWKAIFLELELPRGILLFIVVAFPWYHAMLVRHGLAFWNELIGDNYVHRALGRHGDRGSFEYYLQWIGYGTFPWSGIVALGALRAFRTTSDADPRSRLARFALCWLIVDYVVLSVVRTKFHHYLLPTLPALAILGGLFLDELVSRSEPRRMQLLFLALPLTILCGIDLAALPARALWLFNYDYVNVPGVGRPWPLPSIYGNRYEYGRLIAWIIGAASVGVLALGLRAPETRPRTLPWRSLCISIFLFLLALVIGIAAGPSTHGAAPTIERWRWLVPLALVLSFIALLLRHLRLGARGPMLLALVAVCWSAFLVDGLLVDVSPHWSQKHVIASYYAKRAGPEEPLVVWTLFWHGENFYTANEIYRDDDDKERTAFVGDRADQKLRTYLADHAGRRMFFLVERIKLDGLESLLPAASRSSVKLEDDSNNKLVLVSAQL